MARHGARRRLRREEAFDGWALRACVNEARMILRKRGRIELREDLSDLHAEAPQAPRSLRPLILRLPEKDALALTLMYYEDYSNFYHQGFEHAAPLAAQPLTATDAFGLSRLRVTPIDSAWIEGRLTLTLHVSAADNLPLYIGVLTESDGRALAELYSGDDQPLQTAEPPEGALLLLYESVSLRAGQSLSCAPQLNWETQEDGVLLALQCPADFILASELDELTDGDGRVPLRLELAVRDGDETHTETLLLSAAAPTESEKEAMDP